MSVQWALGSSGLNRVARWKIVQRLTDVPKVECGDARATNNQKVVRVDFHRATNECKTAIVVLDELDKGDPAEGEDRRIVPGLGKGAFDQV